ncbi:MAG: GIY-YIG nuclease family protein [bacterium]
MHCVYILQSTKDKNLYIGCTNDLEKRLLLHNKGKIFSTQRRKPLKLIHYEAFLNQKDAFDREQWLKTGWGHNQIKKILNNYFKNLGG